MSSIKIKVPQKNAEAKLIEKIRTIQRSEKENKKCADCTQMGIQIFLNETGTTIMKMKQELLSVSALLHTHTRINLLNSTK